MILVANKKVHLEYSIEKKMTFGVELFGAEVKSLKTKLGSLDGARVVVANGELQLLGSFIPIYQPKNNVGIDSERTRKLLANKAEIYDVTQLNVGHNLRIFPLNFFVTRNLIKLECGIGKHLKKQDKREVIRKKDSNKSGVIE